MLKGQQGHVKFENNYTEEHRHNQTGKLHADRSGLCAEMLEKILRKHNSGIWIRYQSVKCC